MIDYLRRLRGDLISEGAAYGFTLVIWGTGAVVISAYGAPRPICLFLFLAAPAVVHFVLTLILATVLSAQSSPPVLAQRSSGLVYMNLFSVLPAVACAYGICAALSNPLAGFPLSSAAAMIVYNLLLALQRMVPAGNADSADE